MNFLKCLGVAALVAVAVAPAGAQTRSSVFTAANEDKGAPSIAFVLQDGRTFVSRDAGQTWEGRAGATANWLKPINTDARPAGIVFQRAKGEVYTSRDGGLRWTAGSNVPVPAAPTTPPATPKTEFVPQPEATATIVGLSQNPTSGATDLTFVLSQDLHVTLGVYDQSGNTLIALLDGLQTKGEHVVTINAENLKAGIYYCRLSAASTVSMVKLIVSR